MFLGYHILKIKKKRNNFNCEVNNQEIFKKILEIKSSNESHFDLYFSFKGSGSAKIKKLSNENLQHSSKLDTREFSLKNIIRRFVKKILKN